MEDVYKEAYGVMKMLLLVFVMGVVFISYPLSLTAGTPPEEYIGMKNPFTSVDKAVIERGETLYVRKCKSCHGEKGDGKGPIAEGLKIKPFTKEYLSARSDGFLLWVSENGREGTAMPAFGPGSDTNLSRDDIWKVITFIRERFGR